MDIKVTQGTSTTTAVTAAGEVGQITTFTQTLAAGLSLTFTVNNPATDSDSFIIVGITSYAGTGSPIVRVNNCIQGVSFDIILTNAHASVALTTPVVICFMLQ